MAIQNCELAECKNKECRREDCETCESSAGCPCLRCPRLPSRENGDYVSISYDVGRDVWSWYDLN